MRVDRFRVDPDPVLQLGTARAIGATVLCPGDPEWPARVDDHPLPPVCLWVLGDPDLAALAERSVSVVGAAQQHVSTGTPWPPGSARDWPSAAGRWCPGPRSVSTPPHTAARCPSTGATVAVLAGGVDRPYPLAHSTLLQRIAEGRGGRGRGGARDGTDETAVPAAQPDHRRRCRAASSSWRPALRSGSLNTARTAAEIGRPVGVVPGPVTSMMSSGCHQARRDGLAEIVTDVDEVIDLVGDLGVDAAPRRSAEPELADLLDPTDALVLAVGTGPPLPVARWTSQ